MTVKLFDFERRKEKGEMKKTYPEEVEESKAGSES